MIELVISCEHQVYGVGSHLLNGGLLADNLAWLPSQSGARSVLCHWPVPPSRCGLSFFPSNLLVKQRARED